MSPENSDMIVLESLYGLFQCYCFQIICHFQMRNQFLQGFSRLTGFNRKILVACAWLSM